MHDGCNASAWVSLEVDRDLVGRIANPVLRAGMTVLSQGVTDDATVPTAGLAATLAAGPVVFETLHAVPSLKVKRNAIRFYTWGDPRCCLPRGAIAATLLGSAADLELSAGDV